MTTNDATRPAAGDWSVQAADLIETAVVTVRDKTTVPLRTAARAVVYGIALSVVATLSIVLAIIAAVRGLTLALAPLVGRGPGHQHRVWASYALVGGIFTLAGLFLLRKAEATPQEGK
jgi:hypothetical protein